jgi:hypothetical protein
MKVLQVTFVVAGFLVCCQNAAFAFKGFSVEVSPEASYISYKEPGIDEKGVMYGLSAAAVWHNRSVTEKQGATAKVSGRLGFGQVNYDGQLSDGTPYKIKGIDDLIAETRVSSGYDLAVFDATRLTPYFGLGYRYLNDDSSDDPAGYERESNYLFSPIGIETETDLGSGWFAGASVEYDIFWHGWQKSHLSDAVASLSDVTNDQKGGYGLMGAVKLGKKSKKIDWFAEAFIKYWSIDESERSNVALSGVIIGTAVEPKNHSTEIGLKAGLRF